ncbi:MAG: guanylate kinase [Burkholderiales bacterium]|jgi:guanylate kinase|nr:guanylate kinase [Burkholderiales bacterium]
MTTGNIFVISAPSGAGKSTLVSALCARDPQIKVSISHTTREKRPGDEHGVQYYFTSKDEFERMLQNHQFLEHARVYDNYYGTHKTTIEQLVTAGNDIILEIDHQGAMQIRKLIKDATLIYILPPNIETLKQRLLSRNTDKPEVIEKRLNLALDDISYAKYFDFAVINNDFNRAIDDLYSIILSSRLKTKHVLEIWKA